ncbi:MAG: hypothetical protein A3H72_03270 [Candidatus Doudnabacteria bacterium RIFCSPLOWO2_02_FULL_48_8]|uniref:HAD family hydrolase n=1 Tax=Candidatus Doudnabacteria bacterium RIFCSPHIGHO2_01_FULL_46_24 TaxID=1817825 RepID=A0A1F5NTY1_9BACT|nr:MAG: hypothetical protein A2720_00820 [Candidatus Doudnabacteria bacterium RIFCSPHIGHO2_01_FULL_46_24]OGE94058.1 MAG: hypothetical protein A3E98_01380 [Candidatus Doudnabacteria bacterium RIFCSPHIGHO2_12_FULL_48_11]OGE95115.1 MAG: hypothetical protein A3H72_03270 [Candidatus Doudnabacteria bacterium RIFCSPLOWO2_02_FULL_48_8]
MRKLSKKYQLAVVTARVKKGVKPVLEKYGYGGIFKTLVAFEDYKHPKPDPESLLVALKELRVKPAEAVYVGDMPSDVECANRADVTSINISRDTNLKADFNVRTFAQLENTVNIYARQD